MHWFNLMTAWSTLRSPCFNQIDRIFTSPTPTIFNESIASFNSVMSFLFKVFISLPIVRIFRFELQQVVLIRWWFGVIGVGGGVVRLLMVIVVMRIWPELFLSSLVWGTSISSSNAGIRLKSLVGYSSYPPTNF